MIHSYRQHGYGVILKTKNVELVLLPPKHTPQHYLAQVFMELKPNRNTDCFRTKV